MLLGDFVAYIYYSKDGFRCVLPSQEVIVNRIPYQFRAEFYYKDGEWKNSFGGDFDRKDGKKAPYNYKAHKKVLDSIPFSEISIGIMNEAIIANHEKVIGELEGSIIVLGKELEEKQTELVRLMHTKPQLLRN